ncbi:spermidine synthase [Nocardiopsis sp. NPDC101807]|uniref:spermidine synthase n=1 Tax=Nocardiopsis sp. NPDC101807 TaxID=3364339 RepID=UPI00380F0FC9
MSPRFRELDHRPTPMGVISLRRRWDPLVGDDVYEIKLDDDFLMSSAFTAAEVEVARLALAELRAGPGAEPPDGYDVVVGGLGLGHTALTVLDDPGVRSLLVVEALGEVVDWHREGLVPAGAVLSADPRCRLVRGDFFSRALGAEGLDPESPGRRFHAVVVDIDHSPRHLLHPSHAPFYEPEGVRRLAGRLHPGGVFALWSDDPPDADYEDVLRLAFGGVRSEVVTFASPYREAPASNTVYLGTAPGA